MRTSFRSTRNLATYLRFVEALITLSTASLRLRLLPFRTILEKAAKGHDGSTHSADNIERTIALVASAIEAVARRVPWKAVCFHRALAAQSMLRRRGVGSVLHYGLAMNPANELSGHVWVTANGHNVIGGEEAESFACVASLGKTGAVIS